jgi:spore coat polysaccharide biosynthesis protein SpsF
MPLAGKPMLWHIVERARAAKNVDEVIVATSIEPTDDAIETFCDEAIIPCFRGSLMNVLSRYLEILKLKPYDYVVRVTGDCPLIDPDCIDRQIQALTAHDGDEIWLSAPAPVLGGQGVHSSRSLRYISKCSDHPDDLEHVGSRYLAEHPEQFRVIGLHPPKALTEAHWRVTIDESADYEMIQHLYTALWRGAPIPLSEAIDWMARHPEVASVNVAVQHSAINHELSVKHRSALQYVSLFCDWDDPSMLVSPTYS